MYEACVLSILLNGAECWTTYRHQESRLSAFHRCLRFTNVKTWRDKTSNEDLFKVTKSEPLFSHLKFIPHRWAGHVTRMPPCSSIFLSHFQEFIFEFHAILHSVLKEGAHSAGRPKLRYCIKMSEIF